MTKQQTTSIDAAHVSWKGACMPSKSTRSRPASRYKHWKPPPSAPIDQMHQIATNHERRLNMTMLFGQFISKEAGDNDGDGGDGGRIL